MSADGAAAMVAAAVRAAVLAKAPRRTVAAVAAAVASALGRLVTAAAVSQPKAKVPTGAKSAAAVGPVESAGVPSPEEMLAALRSARAAQRRRRKQRRRAAKEAGRFAEQEEEVGGQPQEPDPGGDLEPSLPTAGAKPVPMDVEAVVATSHRDTNRSGDASPPRKQPRLDMCAESWELDSQRSHHTCFTDDIMSHRTAFTDERVGGDVEIASRSAGMLKMPSAPPPERGSASSTAGEPLQRGRGRGHRRRGGGVR